MNASNGVTDAIVAFAGGAWAMRSAEREAGKIAIAAVMQHAIASARSEAVTIALNAIVSSGAHRPAAPIARTETMGAPDAALISGIAAGSTPACATPVVAAALAAGESARAPGAVVLDAVVAGCEVAVRLARALGTAHVGRGWAVDGTVGRIAAAIAAARIYGLNADRTRHAIGIATTASGGLRSADGTMTARYVCGAAAADGVEAALLARFGFTGAPMAIEGRRGIAVLMGDGIDASAVVQGLGVAYTFTDAFTTEVTVPGTIAPHLEQLERLSSIEGLLTASRA
jgi:2-methylcitrate dehydratase PrpD